MRSTVYVFGWPSSLGGADTKLAHLLHLLHGDVSFTVIPNDPQCLRHSRWTKFLDRRGIRYHSIDGLPPKASGCALSLSNPWFFSRGLARRAKEMGLKVIWSSEMMWHHEGEIPAVKAGVIDKVLYTSPVQRQVLESGYGTVPGVMTGNFVSPDFFPFAERKNKYFAIGRLSRADPLKYPEDFPVFYERLDLPEVRFRVMAWSEALRTKYQWHRFDDRWTLLPAEREEQTAFLHSIDLFVYPLGHNFVESWGRSTVEAMLTGCVPLVPQGHHFGTLIHHGETGFLCGDIREWREHAHRLYFDTDFRRRTALNARRDCIDRLCRPDDHRRIWLQVLA